jgi:DNA-binding MarR family transcriptional regulator
MVVELTLRVMRGTQTDRGATTRDRPERFPDPSPPAAVAPEVAGIFADFLAIMHLQRQLMFRVFARYDLHPGQAFCMRVLGGCGGEISQSALADRLVLSRPTVTRLLQRLERGGLVARRTAQADQRQTLVALTPAGHDLEHRLEAALAEYAAMTLARLPAGDRAELARILPGWRALAAQAVAGDPVARTAPHPSGQHGGPPEGTRR